MELEAAQSRTRRQLPSRRAKRQRTTEWVDLGDGPAGLIAERVLAYDVADYIRFRAVCRSWRRCSVDPRAHSGLDRRFHPWRWTMLRDKLDVPDGRRFLNTSTAECIQVGIPELHDHEMVAVTPEGLLVLIYKPQYATMEFAAWGSGIANDDSTVVLCFHRFRVLGMTKPGDDRKTTTTTTPLMFAGRFYCVDINGVMVLETGPDQPPRLEVAAKLNFYLSSFAHSVHLVDNFGELMRAVFMGMDRSLSVSLEVFPSGSISADTIYLNFDVRERWRFEVGAYHLADGSIERPIYRDGLMPRPHTLVDCLSLTNTAEVWLASI